MSKILESSDAFTFEVLKSEMPVVVDFFATWCQPCKTFSLTFDVVSSRLEDSVQAKFVKMDVERLYASVVREMGIRSIPTTAVFKKGEIVASLPGNVEESALEEFILKNVE